MTLNFDIKSLGPLSDCVGVFISQKSLTEIMVLVHLN